MVLSPSGELWFGQHGACKAYRWRASTRPPVLDWNTLVRSNTQLWHHFTRDTENVAMRAALMCAKQHKSHIAADDAMSEMLQQGGIHNSCASGWIYNRRWYS